MIKHIALFTFTDEATDEDVVAMGAALADLPAAIAEIRSYTIGRDLGLDSENYDYAVIGEFDSPETYQRYATHPEHVHVVSTYVKPIMKHAVRLQIHVS